MLTLYQYEKFLLESFPLFEAHYQALQDPENCPIKNAKKLALNFLEYSCTPNYGFPGEAHNTSAKDETLYPSVYMIPIIYDSSMLLPYLKEEGGTTQLLDTLVFAIKRSRQQNGFWNSLSNEIHEQDFSLFPEDIDVTSVSAMGLHLTGHMKIEECREVGERLISCAMKDRQTGVMATWMQGSQRKVIFERYVKIPKICVGCISNTLWFLSTSGLDTKPEVIPSVNFVNAFIDQLIAGENPEELTKDMYYTNNFFNYFFISRYLDKSQHARNLFGNKFMGLLKKEFLQLSEKPSDVEALDIAAMILTVTNLKMNRMDQEWKLERGEILEVRRKINKLTEIMIGLQNEDGSFKAWIIFRWNRIGHWGGSKAATTGFVVAALGAVQREIANGQM